MRAALDQLRLVWRLFRDPRVSSLVKLVPIAAVLYFVSPMDILPDWFIPGVGYLDDVGVLMLAMRGFVRMAPRRVRLDHQYWLEHGDDADWDVEAEATATDAEAEDATAEGESECQVPIP
jgi:uncharacterized membrane protein YkvA (DUF1232 family)